MKIVAQQIPPGSTAVRVCTDDGGAQFVCIVTPRSDHAWVWLGAGKLNPRISSTLFAYLRERGHSILRFERLEPDGSMSLHRINIGRAS
ncbi:hypothetical protein [Bowmanella denitrificans]|uniref:hypothetical protein n=1 Tax=Bowmanella denitrificans TaxID=366582 RepID=UPI000C9D1156|nr:hypothetical protein [Bowmanella denitrificans]